MDHMVLIEFPESIEINVLEEMDVEVLCEFTTLPIVKAIVDEEQINMLKKMKYRVMIDKECGCF